MSYSTHRDLYSLVDVIVEFVVGGIGEEHTKARPQGEKHLCGRIHPHFRFVNCIEIGAKIVHDAVAGSGQSDASDQQGKEHHIREESGEPDD